MNAKKVVFVSATRADFGKLKPLMRETSTLRAVEAHVFVTGMHMLPEYGWTCQEVMESRVGTVHSFINQNLEDSMDAVLGKTILGFSDFVKAHEPDMIVVHGDRVETLAAASVGALANTLVCHIEGGERSGTIDESLRHAVSKLAHVHLVANESARATLIGLGEDPTSIHIIGSPDIDVMDSSSLPTLQEAMDRYEIPFDEFGIAILHPVTTSETETLRLANTLSEFLADSSLPFLVVSPNNDLGRHLVVRAFESLRDLPHVRQFPSIRFEFFLALLRHSEVMVGNSSAGVREAPHYGIPVVNLGTRQSGRTSDALVLNLDPTYSSQLHESVRSVRSAGRRTRNLFGDGRSAERFRGLLATDDIWDTPIQKRLHSAT